MPRIRVGCVPITWGQFRRAAPDAWPDARILSEVAQAGYEGVSAGPREGQTPQEVVAHLAQFGLKPAPGYLGGEFWKPDKQAELIERARRQAAFAREAGVSELFVAANGFDYVGRRGLTRRETAGHVAPEDGLTEAENEQFAAALNEVGRATLEQGVRICFHNHVGTVIETRDEIDRLLALTDPEAVFLGPDTGHLAWAGADVTAFCRDYAPRIKSMHWKDIDPTVRDQGRAQEWDYGTFTDHGVFVELGEGDVDFPAILRILVDAGFAGWLLAETDVTQKPSALESVTVSRNYMKSIGI